MPKTRVEKSITIAASAEKVKSIITDFNHWEHWSPWLILEPECKAIVSADGKMQEWDGKRIGAGKMEIVKKGDSVIVINYPLIYVLCDFYSPIHDYGFNPYEKIFGENPTVDLCKINNFIVFNKQRFSPVPDDDKLEQLSFRKTDTVTIPGRLKIDFFIYKRALPCI